MVAHPLYDHLITNHRLRPFVNRAPDAEIGVLLQMRVKTPVAVSSVCQAGNVGLHVSAPTSRRFHTFSLPTRKRVITSMLLVRVACRQPFGNDLQLLLFLLRLAA